jgi:hypothetical protein
MFYPGLALFAGRVGIGKTWFLLHSCHALTNGGYVLGHIKVERCGVLYIAMESGKAYFQERLDIITGGEPANEWFEYLTVEDGFPPLNKGGLEALDEYLKENPHVRFVVLDSLTGLMPNNNGRGNMYQAEYQALKPVYDLGINRNVCIVGAWHTNKAESDDPMQMFSGTTGLPAVSGGGRVVLKRGRYSADAELHTMPRDGETKKIGLKWDAPTCQWMMLPDDAAMVSKSDIRKDILKAMDGKGPMDVKAVCIAVDGNTKRYNTFRQRMFQMEKSGELRKTGKGLYEYRNNHNNHNNNNTHNSRNIEQGGIDVTPLLRQIVTTDLASGSPKPPTATAVTTVTEDDIFFPVPTSRRTTLRLYLRSNKDTDQERAKELCTEYGIDYERARKTVQTAQTA